MNLVSETNLADLITDPFSLLENLDFGQDWNSAPNSDLTEVMTTDPFSLLNIFDLIGFRKLNNKNERQENEIEVDLSSALNDDPNNQKLHSNCKGNLKQDICNCLFAIES